MVGRIRFYSGKQVFSSDIHEGRFDIAGLPEGEAVITVESNRPSTKLKAKGTPSWIPIPEKFQHVGETPLKYLIRTGTQTLEVSLHFESVIDRERQAP